MEINSVPIDDTYAEAFESPFARLVITGRSGKWASGASTAVVGCATSIMGCGCEAGIEARDTDFKTPDGRPGDALLFFGYKKDTLQKELIKRIGQVCVPAPTVMVFNGLKSGEPFELGKKIAYFGNGFEYERNLHGRECMVVPITSGEFVIEKSFNIGTGIGGANFWIYAKTEKAGLKAAEHAVSVIKDKSGLILPFVGGIVSAASRLGSRYDFLKASSQENFAPTIGKDKNKDSAVPDGVGAIYEIIIDAVSLETAKDAMKAGIEAACRCGGLVKIGAASFGGSFGSIKISLRESIQVDASLT